ncbi:thioredoxin domain-containing protein [Maribacter sp. 2307ULW6-5]|uniref:thioredoxin domain-containing protein n=1 Tax=Maribacter sp. 2307ULW6-5 TaxID=3386275 RepID=UPI0039BC5FD5
MKKYCSFCLILFLVFSCKDKKNTEGEEAASGVPPKTAHKYTNALVNETSPYLLQHAHNPVNWLPWSEGAFEKAREEGKLVVLSVGYTSCHWCYVMEQESFEDEEVAKLMNQDYISIKVDRDERPDVDAVYQTALQLVKGSGGWPLNVIMLPNAKPVYLGTYHEKENWMAVLANFSKEHRENPEKMQEYADLLTQGVQEVYESPESASASSKISMEMIDNAVQRWSSLWDRERGGDRAPEKFVVPAKVSMLLDHAVLTGDVQVRAHVKKTLDNVLMGGLYDHLGGGFFRYSTDPDWKVPHFEKMLYDNAQLLGLFADAYKVFGDPAYKEAVASTFAFLQREMRGKEGGYISSLDASIDGEEGLFYTWDANTLKTALGADFPLFAKYYNIHAEEVWEKGRYILFRRDADAIFAKKNGMDVPALMALKERWHQRLWSERAKRVRPKEDDKIITSWNALLINGLVRAHKALGEPKYLDAALATFSFLEEHNVQNGALVHSYKRSSKQDQVFLEDYALLANSALQLYEATLDPTYLDTARKWTATAVDKYTDASGLFKYSQNSALISNVVRKEDGVRPSSNAIMAQNLYWLGHLDYNTDYRDRFNDMVSRMQGDFMEYPQNYGLWGSLFMYRALPFYEIVVVGPRAKEMMAELGRYHLPNTLLAGSTVASGEPLFKNRFTERGTLVYVCQDNTCKLPVPTVEEALGQLREFGYKLPESINLGVAF